MKPLKIAIFELTDCEGCELQLLSLKEELFDFLSQIEFVNFRLLGEKNKIDNFDVVFVQGFVGNEKEKKWLKKIRRKTKILVALGACASTGGIPALLSDTQKRLCSAKKIYGQKYQLKETNVWPLNKIVRVDYKLTGCAVTKNQIKNLLKQLITINYNLITT